MNIFTRRSWKKFKYYFSSILSVLLGLIIAFPLIYAIFAGFKDNVNFDIYPPTILPDTFTNLDNFVHVLTKTLITRYMFNSFIIAITATVVRLILSTLASYAFAFFKFKGKNFFFFFIVGTMMIPAEALLISNYLTISGLGLLDSYLGVVCVYFVSATQVFMFRQNFLTISGSLREAAFIDGCNDLQFYSQICIPVSKPVITALGLSSFINVWNTYLWPLLVTNREEMRTVQVGITMLSSSDTAAKGHIFAAVGIILIPMIILFGISQRNIVHGISSGSVKG
jgi:sn-glycerol 3-phosphate transport system permease protein